jgi:hypothetical protein
MNHARKALSITAIAAIALLSGCAATMPQMSYQGATEHDKLDGMKVAIDTTISPSAKFLEPNCNTFVEAQCRTWTYTPGLTSSAYNAILASAIKAEGGSVVSDPSAANVVVKTVITPADDSGYLVLDHYRIGKTFRMNLIPFHHTTYFRQKTNLVDAVTIVKNGKQSPDLSVPLALNEKYEGSTTVGGSAIAASLKLYRAAQTQAVAKILPAISG